MQDGTTLGIGIFAGLALWLGILREARRIGRPARLLGKGAHREAERAAADLEGSWLRVFPTIRRGARALRGSALHLAGDLEESLAVLAGLDAESLPLPVRAGIASIEAANLVLLDRDPDRADALLSAAAKVARPAEDILLAALVRQRVSDEASAAHLFDEAARVSTGGGKRGGAGRRHEEAIVHYLRGLYLTRAGRPTEARADLVVAARSPVESVYVARARAMLEEPEPSEIEGPSSLAPQVVGRGSGAPPDPVPD